jgi:tripartite-type tricarboxylate transporter receptor subunit TctC
LYKQLPYNPQKDFTPIILATMLPSIVVVNGASPIHTMKELTETLKQDPKFGTYASAGNGTPAHLGGELYKRMAGVQASHVPYKGGAPALNDLMGGQTKYMFAILPEAMPLVKSGKLRALAVTTAARLPAYPDLPTVSESGVPGFELIGWYGFLAPAGTRPEVLTKLNDAFAAALKENDVRDRLRALGFEIVGGAPSALTDLMRSETVKWRKVIQDGNITVD